MKKNYTLIFILCFVIFNLSAQLTDVATGLSAPSFFALNGNDLYVSEYSAGNISKIDITDPNPTPITVVSGLSGPSGLVLNGNDLYIAEFDGDRISKIDIADPNPTIVNVLNVTGNPNDLLLNGDELYITRSDLDIISKINITDASPVLVEVANGFNFPLGLELNGNELLVADPQAGKIWSVDISQPTPITPTDLVTGINSPRGLLKIGNDLYVGTNTNGIQKVDLTQSTPTAVDFISENIGAFGLIQNGNDLYAAANSLGKIVKYTFVSFSPSLSFCMDDPVQTGLSGGTPNGGIYSGAGVTDAGNGETFSFDPITAGVGTHTLTYSDGISSATIDYEVFDLPAVTITLADTVFVIDGILPTDIGGGSPAGGVYSDPYNEITDDGNGMTFSFNSSVMPGLFNTITYTYTDPLTGCTNSDSQEIWVEATTGVDDLSSVKLDIFPNPTTGIIHLQGATTDRIEVMDLQGSILRIENTPTTMLDISNFPSGIYFLKIQVGDQVLTRRVLKE